MRVDSPDCLECGTRLRGAYCHTCGQRRLGPGDRRLSHLLRQGWEALTDLEGRGWRTALTFVTDTGALSRAYLDGRRQRYLRPISVFLLVNLFFFLSPPISDFDLALEDHFDQPLYGAWASAQASERAVEAGLDVDELSRAFGVRSTAVAKSMVILHVPLLALVPALFLRRRDLFYAEHVVVAMHLFAFLLLYAQLISWGVFPALGAVLELFPAASLDRAFRAVEVVGAGLTLLLAVLLARALGRAYRLKKLAAVGLLVPWIVGLVVAHGLYRYLQFVVILAMV